MQSYGKKDVSESIFSLLVFFNLDAVVLLAT